MATTPLVNGVTAIVEYSVQDTGNQGTIPFGVQTISSPVRNHQANGGRTTIAQRNPRTGNSVRRRRSRIYPLSQKRCCACGNAL